jgi:hypothetical protein
MHLPSFAGPRRRTRRALLAAALPAVLAGTALPAAAQANLVILDRGVLTYEQQSVRNTSVVTRMVNGTVRVQSSDGIIGHSASCSRISTNEVACPDGSVQNVAILMRSGNDAVEYRLPHQGTVNMGVGDDTVLGGTRQAVGRAIQQVNYLGGANNDTISYEKANQGVSLTPEDGLANDGRPGDRENVVADFERQTGSNFDDKPLFGTPGPDVMNGLDGNDQIAGGGGDDLFVATVGDGADDYHGGPHGFKFDKISYETRTQPLAIDLDNVADDGEAGERDNVRSNVENVTGGSAGDTINSLGAFSTLDGGAGADRLVGGFGPDTLIGGAGRDRLEAGSHSDVVEARDREADTLVDCGSEFDAFSSDSFDPLVVGCENPAIGTLRLTPKTVNAEAGKPAQMRLNWRHPVGWRKLRRVELRLTHDGAPVAEITIRPRAQRLTADGAVQLIRKRSRLTHKGKTVIARLAVRLDESLAGRTLEAEVEATDTRGRRQLERDAGTVRAGR